MSALRHSHPTIPCYFLFAHTIYHCYFRLGPMYLLWTDSHWANDAPHKNLGTV
jgi:hypothetical protein